MRGGMMIGSLGSLMLGRLMLIVSCMVCLSCVMINSTRGKIA